MRTYIYTRVSTNEQALFGYSLEGQAKTCQSYCEREQLFTGSETNCDVPGLIIDAGRSAFRKCLHERPGGRLLLNTLKTGDTVVATTISRMFRNVKDMVNVVELWISQGVNVRFVDYPALNTHTASGKALLQIFAVMAQLRSELASARVREALAIKRHRLQEPPVDRAERVARIQQRMPDRAGTILQLIAMNRAEQSYKFTGQVRGYVRVSTEDQTVEQQKVFLLRNLPAGVQPEDVVWYEDEGYSAFKTPMDKRPAGHMLLADSQPGDLILVWRPDRMFRSLLDMSQTVQRLDQAKVAIHFAESGLRTDTVFGRMMVSMLGVLAELESAENGRAVRQGMLVALAVSEDAQKLRLPKHLRSVKRKEKRQHYYAFENVFSDAQRVEMFMQLSLTEHKYASRREACRVISNIYLQRKGLPPLLGEVNDTRKSYLRRLKASELRETTAPGQRVIKALSKSKGSCVSYPINVSSLSVVSRNRSEWIEVSKLVKDRTACAFVMACEDRESAVAVLSAVSAVKR